MNYEWDENKRIGNLEKHGLDFIDAHELWACPMLLERINDTIMEKIDSLH
jgi:hypothetical protein